MPKMKSHSGAKKRFGFTAKGKVKYRKPFGRHLLTDRASKRMRTRKRGGYLGKIDSARIKKLLPYSA